MKITDIRTIAVRVPVERPTAISTRQLAARQYVLVWIDTDAGHTGIGYTYASAGRHHRIAEGGAHGRHL